MGLDEPFSKLTPPPKIPGDSSFDERFRKSADDTGGSVRSIQAFLRQYRDVDVTADGVIYTVFTRRSRPAVSAVLFGITRKGATATVAKGIVLATTWPDPTSGTMDSPAMCCTRVNVAETNVTLTAGFIYLKVTYQAIQWEPTGTLTGGSELSVTGGRGGIGGAGGAGGGGGGGGGGGQAGGAGGGGGGGSAASAFEAGVNGSAGTNGNDGSAGTAGGAGGAGTKTGGTAGNPAGTVGSAGTGGPGGAAVSGSGDGGVGGSGGSLEDAGDGGLGGNGGDGGGGAAGGAGGYGGMGADAPAYGATGGPMDGNTVTFQNYTSVTLAVLVWKVISAEIVCQAETADTQLISYIPLAEVKGDPLKIEVWHPGGYITVPMPLKTTIP